ncbi:MAG: PIN domain-containing protein [Planctomycetes bacterium]|nr:PIN domain-containing protein [Planctomycetota bacterium]
MAKVYLDTSFFSTCVSHRIGSRSAYWREVSKEWWRQQAPKHIVCISDEVIAELTRLEKRQRDSAFSMLEGLNNLKIDDAVHDLADVFVRERVMPGPATTGDAIHVSVAIIHGMEYLLSWNVKHLANPRKRLHLKRVCLRLGLTPPEILTPDLLQETNDDTE